MNRTILFLSIFSLASLSGVAAISDQANGIKPWTPPFVAPLSYLKVNYDRESGALAIKTVGHAGAGVDVAALTVCDGATPLPVTGFSTDGAKLTVSTAKGAVEAVFAGTRSLIFRATSPALSMKVDFTSPTDWYSATCEMPSKIGRPVVCARKSVGSFLFDARRGVRTLDAEKKPTGAETCAVLMKARGAEPFEFAIRECVLNWEDDLPTGTFDAYVEKARREAADCVRRAVAAYRREAMSAAENATFAAAAGLLRDLQVEPRGNLKRRGILMSKNWMTQVWSWDNVFSAMALAPYDPDLAFEQIQVIYDHQAADGSVPDAVSDSSFCRAFVKPPILGWATKRLFACPGWTRERKELVYGWMSRNTDWWFACRDRDRNGLCEYDHGNDSGWDNSTAFLMRYPIETPDLQVWLVLQMDALAKLGDELGKAAEAQAWRARSERLLETMLKVLFDAEGRPLVRRTLTGETQSPETLLTRYPLLLGDRLPAKIRARTLAEVKSDKYLTAWGLATEPPTSPKYVADGYWLGPIWAPPTMVFVDALETCGEHAAAVDLAARFRRLVERSGFAENFNAVTGEPLRDRAYSWTAAVYMLLSASR